MFRSVDMSYMQVLVPSAVAEDFADRVARRDVFELTDLNEEFQPFQRPYTSDIIKIQDVERRLRTIEDDLNSYGVRFDGEIKPRDLDEFVRSQAGAQAVDATAEQINETFKTLKEQTNAEKQLKAEWDNQKATMDVLGQLDRMLEERRGLVAERLGQSDSPDQDAVPLMAVNRDGEQASPSDVGFKFLAGVISQAQRPSLERQVFLTSRGNSFVVFDEDADDDEKLSFVVFYLGDQLHRSLRRLCQFMNIQVCYESDSEVSRRELLEKATAQEEDFRRIHHATKNSLKREMRKIADQIKQWKITLIQEKSIRIALNKFKSQGSMLRCEGWVPTERKEELEQVLEEVTANKGVGRYILNEMPPQGMPPTSFELDEYTQVFQEIVNTYGVPRYKEFNPAVPTIVTFPFLFGVMYGDMFHGGCLFLVGIILVFFGERMGLRESAFAGAFKARYLLFLMGFFAVYCGMIYNDIMSLGINGWNQTQWTHDRAIDHHGYERVFVVQHDVYAVGVDPAWHGVDNSLEMTNSLKMKLSVILGITQMTFGLFLKLGNHLYEEDYVSLCWEFIPQLVFMASFFHYMVFIIFWKWCINWKTSDLPDVPALITVLINLVLSPGSIDDEGQIFEDKDFQSVLHVILILMLVFSIPCMLVAKPYILKWRYEAEEQQNDGHVRLHDDGRHGGGAAAAGGGGGDEPSVDEESPLSVVSDKAKGGGGGGGGGHGGHGDEEFIFSEVMIHQLIHTIEFVLGTVSNTASYLRLWALSLAHAELSEVFYEKTLKGGLDGSGIVNVLSSTIGVFLFFMFTFAVLLVMDVLECFLHALRLHWVEFQNKFYYADGRSFEPFSYKAAIVED